MLTVLLPKECDAFDLEYRYGFKIDEISFLDFFDSFLMMGVSVTAVRTKKLSAMYLSFGEALVCIH